MSWWWHGFHMVDHRIILWLTLIQTSLTMFQLCSQQLGWLLRTSLLGKIGLVAGMKIAFLPFLTQHGPTFWPPKCQNMEFLKQNFNFQSLRKTEVIFWPSMWFKDWLTKVKTSKIVTFCYFWPKMGKHFVLIFFRYGVSS